MNTLFGLSMTTIMAWMLGAFLATAAVLGILALRNRLLLKLGLRNIPRRRAQTVLIVVGLMLSTVIITSALGIGDTMTYSLRTGFTTSLGRVDEVVTTQAGSRYLGGPTSYAPAALVTRVRAIVAGHSAVAAVTEAGLETIAVTDETSRQTKSTIAAFGVPTTVDPAFGFLTSIDGNSVALADLQPNEVYLDALAATALNAHAGDRLTVYATGGARALRVRAVLRSANLAASGGGLSNVYRTGLEQPELLLPLSRFDTLSGHPGTNLVLVANRGDVVSGATQSDRVTDLLRTGLADPAQVSAARTMLSSAVGQAAVSALLKTGPVRSNATLKTKLTDLQRLARQGGTPDAHLVGLLSDGQVAGALSTIADPTIARPLADTLIALSPYVVAPLKQSELTQADLAGNIFASIFIAFSLFSIAAGVMLIFLIFVMLAAERRPEMGMARAVGTKRRQLIQQFLFEGYLYNLGAALVGVSLGIGVGFVMTSLLNNIFGTFGLPLQSHIELRSLVIAFCLGALLTFLTVAVSAWRTSRLNIVAAIRDLPEEALTDARIGTAFRRPFRDLAAVGRRLRAGRPFGALRSLLAAPWHMLTFWGVFISRGPVPLLLGALVLRLDLNTTGHPNGSLFRLGGTLLLIGAAMLLRWLLAVARVSPRLRNRIGYTLAGLGLVVFFLVPLDTFHAAGKPIFDSGPELFFLSGLVIVLGGVWAVMFNADLLLGALLVLFGRGEMAPILRMAVSYPMQNKFRTGMTVSMFSLVIFLLMLISVLLSSTRSTLDLNRDAGGFALSGTVSSGSVIRDLPGRVASDPTLRQAVAGTGAVSRVAAGVRQPGQRSQSYSDIRLNVADDAYLRAQRWTLHSRASGYANDAAVWRAVGDTPGAVVIAGSVVNGDSFSVSGITYTATTFRPVTLDLRDPRGRVYAVHVIGVLDTRAGNVGTDGIFAGRRTLEAVGLSVPPPTTYYIRVAPGYDVHSTALALGSAFVANGLDVTEMATLYAQQQAAGDGLFNLLEGFIALGLVVGVAALGVIALRSVVERRQQIGMLRAIGFKRTMVQAVFLIENSVVAVLGTVLGLVLGLLVARQYVDSLGSSNPNAQLTVPWLQVALIVVIAYAASLVTTYLPAWQAARIYPAEALRYE